MTQLWGSETTVKALLDAFVSSFRDDLDTLRALLDGGSVAQLREWHHRVIGAASVLQYRPLHIALDRFRRDLVDKPDSLRRQDGAALIARCEVLLERLKRNARSWREVCGSGPKRVDAMRPLAIGKHMIDAEFQPSAASNGPVQHMLEPARLFVMPTLAAR